MGRFKSPFTAHNINFYDEEEQMRHIEYMATVLQKRQLLEKIEKSIYKPIYRLDSYKSMPLEDIYFEQHQKHTIFRIPFHKPSIGLIFGNRIKPKIKFNSLIRVHEY